MSRLRSKLEVSVRANARAMSECVLPLARQSIKPSNKKKSESRRKKRPRLQRKRRQINRREKKMRPLLEDYEGGRK